MFFVFSGQSWGRKSTTLSPIPWGLKGIPIRSSLGRLLRFLENRLLWVIMKTTHVALRAPGSARCPAGWSFGLEGLRRTELHSPGRDIGRNRLWLLETLGQPGPERLCLLGGCVPRAARFGPSGPSATPLLSRASLPGLPLLSRLLVQPAHRTQRGDGLCRGRGPQLGAELWSVHMRVCCRGPRGRFIPAIPPRQIWRQPRVNGRTVAARWCVNTFDFSPAAGCFCLRGQVRAPLPAPCLWPAGARWVETQWPVTSL